MNSGHQKTRRRRYARAKYVDNVLRADNHPHYHTYYTCTVHVHIYIDIDICIRRDYLPYLYLLYNTGYHVTSVEH